MFYSEDLLTSKNGAFGIVWLAATLGIGTKRLSKRDWSTVDLTKTCELIAQPPEPMALRLSGNLLVGVARVYNQNYAHFYADVTTFHTTLRRVLVETPGIGAVRVTTEIDINGDGKSRFDQITFADLDVSWRSVLDTEFGGIDWGRSFTKRPRRASSQLESLNSQASHQDGRDDDDVDEYDDDDDESEQGRTHKRIKVATSPSGSNGKMVPGRPSTQIMPVEINAEEFTYDGDGIFGPEVVDPESSNDSFAPADFMDDMPLPDNVLLPEYVSDLAINLDPQGQGSRAVVPDDGIDAAADQGSAAEEVNSKQKKRARHLKRVGVDQVLELVGDVEAQRNAYRQNMREQNALHSARQEVKEAESAANALVDGAGNWLDFLDPDMNAFFATLTKAGKYKWEQHHLADKLGQDRPRSPTRNSVATDAPVNFIENQGDITVDSYAPDFDFLPGDDLPFHHDDGPPPASQPTPSGRSGSVEVGRRAVNSSQKPRERLPWEGPRSVTQGNDDIPFDNGPVGFTPGSSLRLSIMTPQEVRIRRLQRSSSGRVPLQASLSRGPGRDSRSRSGSVLVERHGRNAKMLIGPNDDEIDEDDDLPVDSQREITDSQAMNRDDVPDAFQPEMLATLERQCREFLSYLEAKVAEQKDEDGDDEVDFSSLVPAPKAPMVTAMAFYNCLTLATKSLIRVSQEEPWGDITITLAA